MNDTPNAIGCTLLLHSSFSFCFALAFLCNFGILAYFMPYVWMSRVVSYE